MSTEPRVAVVGSLNIDYIARVHRLPRPGETLAASELIQRFGGKGANQAVAAARQGAKVSMLGCIGQDDHGAAYRQRLQHEKIDVEGLFSTTKSLTGTALIAVDDQGENMIVVAAGANGELRPAHVRRRARHFMDMRMLLLQFEVSMAVVSECSRIANRCSIPVTLNPSPWRKDFPWGKWAVDTLICNEVEAASIFGFKKIERPPQILKIQRQLRGHRIDQLLITRGSQSTLCIRQAGFMTEVPVLKVKPVDTVGAGDAFAGAYVAARARGLEFLTAVRWANCAGALATLRVGAQESIPTMAATRKAVQALPR